MPLVRLKGQRGRPLFLGIFVRRYWGLAVASSGGEKSAVLAREHTAPV